MKFYKRKIKDTKAVVSQQKFQKDSGVFYPTFELADAARKGILAKNPDARVRVRRRAQGYETVLYKALKK